MIDNTIRNSPTPSNGTPPLALLPVYESLNDVGNLEFEARDYVTVPAAVFDLPGLVFGLRCEVAGGIETDPSEDVLILWYGSLEDMLDRLPFCAGLVSSDHRGNVMVFADTNERDPRVLQYCGVLVGVLYPHQGNGEIVIDCFAPAPEPVHSLEAAPPPAEAALTAAIL
jgi:hypothetical protein